MENRNYKVDRNNIYVGDVIGIADDSMRVLKKTKSKTFFRKPHKTLEEVYKEWAQLNSNRTYYLKRMNFENLGPDEEWSYIYYHKYSASYNGDLLFRRSMLFTLDENNHADDLLYDSPHYPIFDISPDEDCLKSPICIGHNTYELRELLKYDGFSEELGYEDILRIRSTYFTCDYVLNNCEFFGIRETGPHETSTTILDSEGNHRTFNDYIEGTPFPYTYFFMLAHNKDYYDYHSKCVKDAFKPRDEEGIVKSLGTITRN